MSSKGFLKPLGKRGIWKRLAWDKEPAHRNAKKWKFNFGPVKRKNPPINPHKTHHFILTFPWVLSELLFSDLLCVVVLTSEVLKTGARGFVAEKNAPLRWFPSHPGGDEDPVCRRVSLEKPGWVGWLRRPETSPSPGPKNAWKCCFGKSQETHEKCCFWLKDFGGFLTPKIPQRTKLPGKTEFRWDKVLIVYSPCCSPFYSVACLFSEPHPKRQLAPCV